ncbi:hypothetical protein P691DRAFT_781620 [Macrolepiota fuliginosa MF-IS2]|uniref:Uncharacterized protein n=1 Tax=Macrolepiota fuliginosa MF-IS2 TaxID=1400762 RepID=A0A9P6BWR0_9AGAR|nr:hypothetical protein P691DRAFT_781620 [Macrolepiota fuliginosa MF-IS2]
MLYETFKKHVQLFKPCAFPALYKWTTYPLTVLLESISKQAQAVYRRDVFQHAIMVELFSVIENALNFMHTRNTVVIATTVMNPLWIGSMQRIGPSMTSYTNPIYHPGDLKYSDMEKLPLIISLCISIWKITLYLVEYWDNPYALGTVGKPQSVAFRRYPDRCGMFSCC